ncbi:MAG: hypothetical protein PF518_14100 [Spirochaetaceae bacterium]|jgi:hypothetical protein|nr:hypothetical protein [Spirochaetaceae bacterium]
MDFQDIKIEELSWEKIDLEKVFVQIPFLYSPVLQELKRKESLIREVFLHINLELVEKMEVLLSLLRIFNIPDILTEVENVFTFTYLDKSVEIKFTHSGLMFEGTCELPRCKLVFSENLSYIKIEKNDGKESIIALPEGDGFYYLNLDKKESSEEERLSIIGHPLVLKEKYNWLMEHIHG